MTILYPAGPSAAEYNARKAESVQVFVGADRINAELGQLARPVDQATQWGAGASIMEADGEAVWIPLEPAEVLHRITRLFSRDQIALGSLALVIGGFLLARLAPR